VGDTGTLSPVDPDGRWGKAEGRTWRIVQTRRTQNGPVEHFLEEEGLLIGETEGQGLPLEGAKVRL